MSERDKQLLIDQMNGTAETVRAYARQIESGEYVSETLAAELDDTLAQPLYAERLRAWAIAERLIDPDDASDYADEDDLAGALEDEGYRVDTDDGNVYKRDEHDAPTLSDSYGNHSPIDDYPLEIVDERGREFAVVLCTGGPHIEVVADGGNTARLEGYWWGDRWTMHGDYLDTFLDYFIERD